MKSTPLLLASLVAACAACHYPGAIYTEFTQFGLGVRSSPESASPVDIHMGYERGVLAIVPKRADGEDATSLISRTDIGTNLNRTDKTLLSVSSDFIAGTAAIASTIPAGAKVEFVENGKVTATTTTVGEDRIGTALRLSARTPTVEIAGLDAAFAAAVKHPKKDEVFEAAAPLAPAEFKALYDGHRDSGKDPKLSFTLAKNTYTRNAGGEGPKLTVLSAALNAALAEIDEETP